ncbi:MAG: acetyl-CoA hydrolase/transferase C-terminal domain-containing protein [Capnocytophaga sp.]|nr:acetyl-CoA hydrolase/transferase C-terminal domain-containing protein [Capnocytophaga sp.]
MGIYTTADEAVKVIQDNNTIYVHGGAAVPSHLVEALTARADELRNVTICHIHTEGSAPYADPKYSKSFYVNSFFLAKNVRHTLTAGNGSYTPIFLSDLALLFNRNLISLDVVLVQVSPPDRHGYCTMGVSVEACKSAIHNAKIIIAQVNEQMPRVFGDGILHVSEIDFLVPHNAPIYTEKVKEPNDVENKIGSYVAELIDDGSTIQMGIGSIPNAALLKMGHLKNLGIHTELLTDGVLDLIENGVINGSQKKVNKGKSVATFMLGSQRLYDFANDNPFIELRESSFTNDTAVIRRNPRMISINSAIEVDITGQVCADSIGTRLYSGVGGQMDFVRGASLSEGGKAIIALPSVTKDGISRICPFLKQGAGVVTTRSHVQYVITEHGVAYLFGKTLHERIKAMINIAHPDHRESLERQYFERK